MISNESENSLSVLTNNIFEKYKLIKVIGKGTVGKVILSKEKKRKWKIGHD